MAPLPLIEEIVADYLLTFSSMDLSSVAILDFLLSPFLTSSVGCGRDTADDVTVEVVDVTVEVADVFFDFLNVVLEVADAVLRVVDVRVEVADVTVEVADVTVEVAGA